MHLNSSLCRLTAASLASFALIACGDDETTGDPVDTGVIIATDSGATPSDSGVVVTDAGPEADAGATDTGSTDVGSADAGVTDAGGASYPQMPAAISLTGCDDLGLGALCTVTQTDGTFAANCSGVLLDGTIDTAGQITMTRPTYTNTSSDAISLSCTGALRSTRATATCTRTTTPVGGTAVTETCNLVATGDLLPGVTCMELPAQLSAVSICTEGMAMGGQTIAAGDCSVVQDDCIFQASCTGGQTLYGSVSTTGLSFSQAFPALADAQTPSNGGSPAFLAGESVSHACSATVMDGTLAGSCEAGRSGRGGMNTSVCSIGGTAGTVGQCTGLPEETIFALDSCDVLENGENGIPGIGEPLCVFRRSNCVWEVDCGGPQLTFSGRIQPGAQNLDWTLATGTPCTMQFDSAGNPTGSCTVPGQAACALSSKTAVPGGSSCPILPSATGFYGRGCGAVATDHLQCRLSMQHGCDFAAVCNFRTTYPSVVIRGQSSYSTGTRGRLDFNGLNDWTCYVDEATADDIANDGRVAGEWYGQCSNPAGGMCRDNYDPTTGSGLRGLQLFFSAE